MNEELSPWVRDNQTTRRVRALISCATVKVVCDKFVTDLDNSLSSHTSMSSGMNGWVTGGEAWIELMLSCLCQQVGALGSCKLTTDKHI